MSCRLTEEMLENVVFENWQEVINYTTSNIGVNVTTLRDACHLVRQMYYDALGGLVGTIQDENFYYGIPKKERFKKK